MQARLRSLRYGLALAGWKSKSPTWLASAHAAQWIGHYVHTHYNARKSPVAPGDPEQTVSHEELQVDVET